MHDERGVRRGVFCMNLAEPIGHVGIESSDKRDARGAAEPGGTDPGDRQAEHESEGRNDPADAHARGHATDSLYDALKNADLIFADRHEQGQRGADVKRSGKNAAPGDRSRKSFQWVLDFITHYRGELQANQAEADDAEGVQNKARVRGDAEVRSGDGSSEAKPNGDAEDDQKPTRDKRAETANVVDPFADAETNDVENHEDGKERKRGGKSKGFACGEPGLRGAKNEDRYTNEVQHDGRNIHHVVGPVAPARKKTMEVAKYFLGPEVDAAFSGIAVSEFNDGDALRPEKKQQRDYPKPDGDAAVAGDGRNHVQIEDGDDE